MKQKRCVRQGCQLSLIAFGIVLLVVAVVGVWNWRDLSARAANMALLFDRPEYFSGLSNADEALDFLQAQRDMTAFAAYTVRPDGSAEQDAFFLNADAPMPLASTVKIIVLLAYACEVDANRIDPEAPVALGEWEQYYLPGTDGGAHPAALERLKIAADAQGFAQDPQQTVTLDQVVNVMIRESDNAAADYVLAQLGDEAVRAAMDAAGVRQHDPIVPLVGMFLSWRNHEQPEQDTARIQSLLGMDSAAYAAEVRRLTEAYRDQEWRAAELVWRAGQMPTSRLAYERMAVAELAPQGTARDYAHAMAGVVSGQLISPGISTIMRRHLEWPMEIEGNPEQFRAFGAKGGSLAGVLTEAMYLVPASGEYAGRPRVMVVFMREMPMSAWIRLTQTFAHQQVMVQYAREQTFAERVQALIEE